MRRDRVARRGWAGGAVLVAASVGAAFALPVHAASNSSPYNQPRWWAKYQVVSTAGFTPRNGGSSTSVSVGSNVDASNESGPQSETAIAISPTDPKSVVAGANEIARLPMRAMYSTDGGKTYTGVDLPLPAPLARNGFDFGSDPGVAWDTLGNVYYSYIIVFFSPGGSINGTEMAVARSSDKGAHWTPTYFNLQTGSAQFNDKPMIAVDQRPGPLQNTVYVAWDNSTGNSSSSNHVLVSRSTDLGQTFSAPVFADSTAGGPKGVIGADPVVGPDGTLYVAWHDVQNSLIAVSASTDGGQHFRPTHTVAPTQAAFDIGVPAQASRRALVYPTCGAAAGTVGGPGVLYCSWTDSTPTNGSDVFVSRSTDGGATWSSPVRANTDPVNIANDQFNQWLAVDPADGSVNVSWNDTRNDPSHLSTDIFYGRSTDGASSFSNTQVTTAPTNETCCGADLGDQYGDYEGIAALNGTIRPVWTDRRAQVISLNLDEEVFTAAITTK